MAVPSPPHGFGPGAGAPFTLRTPLPLYPGLKTVDVGFAAAGSAGNASASVTAARSLRLVDRDAGREFDGDDVDDEAQGVTLIRIPALVCWVEGCGKNKFVAVAAEPQLPVRLTADLDDWAVELLSFKTLLPPCDVVDPAILLAPGRDG